MQADIRNRPIQSLWIGNRLSVSEQLCIKSFLKNGHDFHLYTYEKVAGIPDGTIVMNASDIMALSNKYEIKNGFGANSKAPFSDVFRLNLLYKKGGWWVDMDVICLKNFNTLPLEIITTSLEIPEGDYANINVLSFPARHPFIKECLNKWEEFNIKNLYYAVGVDLVKSVVEMNNNKKFIVNHSLFNPISYRLSRYIFTVSVYQIPLINIYKRIRKQEIIELPSEDSFAIHLWNESLKSLNRKHSRFSLFEKLKRKYL